MQTYKLQSAKSQRGATLIVALVILGAMTVLGFTSLRNTGLQQSIIKNTQFLMYARNVARTEINGQLDVINTNLDTESDPVIQTILDAGINTDFDIAIPGNPAGLTTSQSAYDQTVTMVMSCESCPAPTGGFSFSGAGVMALTARIESRAELNSTAAKSEQSQGYWYLIPSN